MSNLVSSISHLHERKSRFKAVATLSRKLGSLWRYKASAKPWLGYLEALEQRIFLNGQVPSHVVAEYHGDIDDPSGTERVPISVLVQDFTSNRLGTVDLGFHVRADEGSDLDPAAVQIRDGNGNPVPPRYADPDLSDGQSLVLAELEPGDYEVSTSGEQGTLGPYSLEVFLVGDADGSGNVDRAEDSQIMRQAFGSRSGDTRYRVEADANLDGRITSFDMAQHIRNIQARVQVEPSNRPPNIDDQAFSVDEN